MHEEQTGAARRLQMAEEGHRQSALAGGGLVLVVAGSARQFTNYVAEQMAEAVSRGEIALAEARQASRRFKYVSRGEDVRGIAPQLVERIEFVGTWSENAASADPYLMHLQLQIGQPQFYAAQLVAQLLRLRARGELTPHVFGGEEGSEGARLRGRLALLELQARRLGHLFKNDPGVRAVLAVAEADRAPASRQLFVG